MTRRILALLPLLALALPLPADVLILKDGKRVEGDVTDKGNIYEVKTPYGTLLVDKAEVVKLVKNPAQLAAEAEMLRKIARGMYDDALKIENDPKDRNKKLTAGLEILEKVLRIYTEGREIFPGNEGRDLDKAATEVIQEMRLYRDKMSTELARPPEPPKPEPPKPEPPAPAAIASTDPAPATLSPVAPPAAAPKPVVPLTPAPKPDAPASVVPPPPATAPGVARTPQELIVELKAADAAVRAGAAESLVKTKPAEALGPLAEAFKKETDAAPRSAMADALAAYDGAKVAQQPALADAASKGTDEQKRALIALFKKAGTEPGVRFLVDQFVARGEMALRNDVASALKKHKKLAVRPLIDCFGRSGSKPDIQSDIIKYLGILAESGKGAAFLVALFEPDGTRNQAINAILGIDRPSVPALIQGLGGANHTRIYAALVLRTLTGQMLTSQKLAEWNQWWVINRKTIEAEQAKQERADEASDWRVTDADWNGFDNAIELGSLTIYRPYGRAGRGDAPSRRREE